MVVALIATILIGVALGPVGPSIKASSRNGMMQQARQIGQVLFSFSNDNTENGHAYPDGKSSTEVFQMLLDKGYATDPALFYVPMQGKVKPEPGQKLKPENVCWDITGGVTPDDTEELPVVFATGYRVNYVPGAAALPVIKPFPNYYGPRGFSWLSDGFFDWLFPNGLHPTGPGTAVFYKKNNATWLKGREDGSIPNFVSPDFNPHGKTYRQLTPEGELPPQ